LTLTRPVVATKTRLGPPSPKITPGCVETTPATLRVISFVGRHYRVRLERIETDNRARRQLCSRRCPFGNVLALCGYVSRNGCVSGYIEVSVHVQGCLRITGADADATVS